MEVQANWSGSGFGPSSYWGLGIDPTERFSRLHIEWLPPYAPDLNPVEAVWQHSKHAELANDIPNDVDDLEWQVHVSMHHIQSRQTLLRSFLKREKLKLQNVCLSVQ
ncbi:MAG: hypothetical protein GXP29_06435 [Planctomycetes bacterium]|nr:hypothetical protein [Planctomycetota bacterium]